jgi:multisubunit Na+/H+ antiporter MnhC subunit
MDSASSAQLFRLFGVFIILLFVIGVYCIVVTSTLIRMLIGLEILTKGVTLLIGVAGYLNGKTGLSESFIITLIIVEVVVIIVAGGIVLSVFARHGTIDVKVFRRLKG